MFASTIARRSFGIHGAEDLGGVSCFVEKSGHICFVESRAQMEVQGMEYITFGGEEDDEYEVMSDHSLFS